jgi:hypothetical protein
MKGVCPSDQFIAVESESIQSIFVNALNKQSCSERC